METLYSTSPISVPQRFRRLRMNLICLLIATLFFSISQVKAQDEKSTTTLFTTVTQGELSTLTPPSVGKLANLQTSAAFKRALPVKFGNLAKIQKKGYLTFSVPGVSKEYTFHAQKVDAASESDYKWVGITEDNL